jgi:hypothetical protein
LPGPFDAAVGRLVLLYAADPAAALATVATHVHPGGLVAFQEMEMNATAARAVYGETLLARVVEAVCGTFAAAGVRVNMASELRRTFVKAGLGKPEVVGEFVVGGGEDSAGYSWLANTLRSLAPLSRKVGIPLEPLGDLETLAQRMRAEAASTGRDFWSPPYVGAFVRLAGEAAEAYRK